MKWFTLLLAGLVFYGLIGCTKSPVASEEKPDFTIQKSPSVTRMIAEAPEENISKQATSNNTFAVEMYKQLISEGENLFFSPYSITVALAMTAAGAAGNTKQQIRDALQVTLEGDQFDDAINGIDLDLTEHADATEGVTLRIVNSTWLQSGWQFKFGYLDHLSRYYGAGVNMMDFSNAPEACREIINTWVADQTNQKILDLLLPGTITSSTTLVLTNAIYFLADWLYSFNPENTTDKDFTLIDNSTVRTPIMQLNDPNEKAIMLYSRLNNARALDFPYKGNRLAMTVLLPDEGTFSSFESALNLEAINQMIEALTAESLVVALPKFEFTYGSCSIVDALKALGMIDAFSPGAADFSGIDGTKSLYVSNVLHKAFISVDEEGTEAAAATAVTFDRTSVDPNEVAFYVNRPFIYLIRDKETGTILFMGRIVNPTVSE
jgi:serpin B